MIHRRDQRQTLKEKIKRLDRDKHPFSAVTEAGGNVTHEEKVVMVGGRFSDALFSGQGGQEDAVGLGTSHCNL